MSAVMDRQIATPLWRRPRTRVAAGVVALLLAAGGVGAFALSGVNALPYHIYVVSTKIPQNEYTERVQYGTTFVFLAVVMVIALSSVLLRIRLRNRLKW